MKYYLNIQHKDKTNLSTKKIENNAITIVEYGLKSEVDKEYCIAIAYLVDKEIKYLKDPLTNDGIMTSFDSDDKQYLGDYINEVCNLLDDEAKKDIMKQYNQFLIGKIPQYVIEL